MVIEHIMICLLDLKPAQTKANTKLRRYERLFLRNMINCVGSQLNKRKIHDILKGKTITKRIKYLKLGYFDHVHRRKHPHILQDSKWEI